MSARTHPAQRHDGQPWKAQDRARQARVGHPLRMRGVIIYFKGDWAEYNTTMGFPSWQDALRPCFECNAFQPTMYQFSRVTLFDQPWRENAQGDYEATRARCELHVRIGTRALLVKVSTHLRYDKRSGGPKGRCLIRDLPELGLLQDDRLEPTPELRDVGALEDMCTPCVATFWRPSLETVTRHRNPVFGNAWVLTPRNMTIDLLHGLNLGVMSV